MVSARGQEKGKEERGKTRRERTSRGWGQSLLLRAWSVQKAIMAVLLDSEPGD
jgi:hypothetical protein